MIKYRFFCTLFVLIFSLLSPPLSIAQNSSPCSNWEGNLLGNAIGYATHDDCNGTTFDLSAMAYQSLGSHTDNQVGTYQTLCGNGEVIIHHTSMMNGLAGIELRASLDADAAKVAVAGKLSSLTEMLIRSGSGLAEGRSTKSALNRHWYKIVRNGNSFSLHHSSNGTSWFIMKSTTIVMPDCIYLGTFARSNSAAINATASLENLTISGFTDPITTPTEINFTTTDVTVAPNSSTEICVNLNEVCHCSSTIVKVKLKNSTPSEPHLNDFSPTWLTFENGSTQECFTLGIGDDPSDNLYKLILKQPSGGNAAVIGSDNVLDVNVVAGYSPNSYVCGVIERPERNFTPEEQESLFSDRFGNYYTADELTLSSGSTMCTSSGYFSLDYGSNFTPEEMNTICQAFADLSMLFDSEQSNIPIRIKKEALPTDVHGAGTAFWRAAGTSGACGIENNLVWEHINTSVDFEDVLQSNYIAAEFILNLTAPWHTLDMDMDINGNGSFTNPIIDPDFVDLYSVTLHEALHILGFNSRITPNGSPFEGFYSSWDRHLFDNLTIPNPTEVIVPANDSDCCDAHQYNLSMEPSALNLNCNSANQDARIVYQYGPNSSDVVTVYGDYPLSTPVSLPLMINILSHINEDCDSDSYVMHSALAGGEDKRVLSTTELNILCSLGYDGTGETSCASECEVVAMDDFFDENNTSGFTGLPNDLSVTIPYTDIIGNDVLSGESPSTIEIRDCDLFTTLIINDFPDNLSFQIQGLISGYSHSLCYSITAACGGCDEGMITILTSADGPVVGDGPPCGSMGNILTWGDFEFFEGIPVGPETYFVYTNFQACDPLGVNTGSSIPSLLNSPGAFMENGNHVGFLRGNQIGPGAPNVNNINNESIYLRLNQPIYPGCTISLSMDIMTYNGGGGTSTGIFDNGEVGNIQIYASNQPPCVIPYDADCNNPPVSSLDFQCIESGELINAPIPNSSPLAYQTTWTNDTDKAMYYLLIANHVNDIYTGTGQSAACLIDNIIVTQECSNELVITPTVVETCMEEEIIIEYEICLSGIDPTATDVELTIDFPDYPGLTFGNGDFQSNTYVYPGLIPNGDCGTVTLALDVSNSPIGIGTNLAFTLTGLALDACIEGPMVTELTIEECIPLYTCPCEGPNAINIDASDGTPWQNTSLATLVAPSVFGQNTIDLSNHCVSISGTLLVEPDALINEPDLIFLNGALRMQPESEIIVQTNAELLFFGVNETDTNGSGLHACEFMWKGVTVESGATLNMLATTIEDARAAVTAHNQTTLSFNTNVFNNNQIGILVPANNGVFQNITIPPTGIVGNTFDNPNGLIGTFDGEIASGDQAEAGILLNDVSWFTVGSNAGTAQNHFTKLKNGIVTIHSSIGIYKSTFQGITFNGILAERNSFVIAQDNTFDIMLNGIFARSSSLSADNNTITNVEDGIFSDPGALGLLEVKTNNITANRNCINVGHPIFSHHINISQTNELTLRLDNNGNYPADRAAIRFSDVIAGGLLNDATISNNNIYINGVGQGIVMENSGDVDIQYNDIVYQNQADVTGGIYDGISLIGADQSYLFDNDISIASNSQPFPELTGININASTKTLLCYNSTRGGGRGVAFSGSCHSTKFLNTIIGNQQIGLHLGAAAVIGPQIHAGNQWLGAFGVGAQHLGAASLSPFEVELPIAQPYWPPLPILDGGEDWFTDTDCMENPCDYDTPCAPIPDPQPLQVYETTDLDIITATSEWLQYNYGDMLQWENSKNLYGSLILAPLPLDIEEEISSFYITESNSITGAYVAVNNQMKELAAIQAGNNTILIDLTTAQGLVAEIEQIDLDYSNTVDDIEQAALANTLQQKVEDLRVALGTIDLQQETAKTQLPLDAANIIGSNNTLATPHVLAENQKMVNAIYLDLLSTATIALDQSQTNSLLPIANQCPLTGGNAVYRARALLKMNGDYLFDNDNCTVVQTLRSGQDGKDETFGIKEQTKGKLDLWGEQWRVYPNPANDQFHITSQSLDQLRQVMLYDLHGQLVQKWATNGEHTEYMVKSGLPDGIYLIQLEMINGSTINQKLVIAK